MRVKETAFFILILCHVSSCATTSPVRFGVGAGIGALVVGGGAVALSPNSESRPLNALVFGLTGALIGGLSSLLIHPDAPAKPSHVNASRSVDDTRLFLAPKSDLPSFVKERLTPVVIEEFTEKDAISEDGSLHEPHKVYRILRQAELISKPTLLEDLSQ